MHSDIKNSTPIRLVARISDHGDPESLDITPLHTAAFHGSLADVKALLKAGADVNAVDEYGWTPLHDAAIQGHTDIVKLLLAAGARVNVQDEEDRYTPLHDAARMNHAEIVKLLCAAGANTSLREQSKKTARELASEYGFKTIVDLLR